MCADGFSMRWNVQVLFKHMDCRSAGELTNKMKPGRADPVTRLQDKPWPTCLAWLPGDSGELIASGTGYHRVRLYDVKAQKRPVLDLSWRDARITALAAQPDGNYVWVANAKGFIQVSSSAHLNRAAMMPCKHERMQC
jgi:WD40 repeat protein